MTEFNDAHVHLKDNVKRLPELGWRALDGAASEKQSSALLNFAKREAEDIETELKKRTLESKTRQETARAQKLEAEARVAEVKEVEARIELYLKLKALGVIPVWDGEGRVPIVTPSANFDWTAFETKVISPLKRQIGAGDAP